MSNQDTNYQEATIYSVLLPGYTNKVTTIQGEVGYAELDNFRQQISDEGNCYYHQPYALHKKKAFSYRVIFASIGIFFSLLMMVVSFKTTSWFYNFYLGDSFALKACLGFVCALFSFAALSMAYSISAEKEAVQYFLHKAKCRIAQLYARKRAGLGIRRFLDYSKAAPLQHSYQETVDQMHDLKEHTYRLLNQIASAKELNSKQREILYNQSILEMRDRLNKIIQAY